MMYPQLLWKSMAISFYYKAAILKAIRIHTHHSSRNLTWELVRKYCSGLPKLPEHLPTRLPWPTLIIHNDLSKGSFTQHALPSIGWLHFQTFNIAKYNKLLNLISGTFFITTGSWWDKRPSIHEPKYVRYPFQKHKKPGQSFILTSNIPGDTSAIRRTCLAR